MSMQLIVKTYIEKHDEGSIELVRTVTVKGHVYRTGMDKQFVNLPIYPDDVVYDTATFAEKGYRIDFVTSRVVEDGREIGLSISNPSHTLVNTRLVDGEWCVHGAFLVQDGMPLWQYIAKVVTPLGAQFVTHVPAGDKGTAYFYED